MKYDVCIIGSGAGAGPVAYTLARAGKKVVVLEKGGMYSEKDFSKDEVAYCRRDIFTPNLRDEYHIIEQKINGKWVKTPTYESGWSFWNGNFLGGSSNFMSGYFHRMSKDDFRLVSRYGEIKGANVVDWPISYKELEPYYDKVEKIIGVSGGGAFYPALEEQPISKVFDESCEALGFIPSQTSRAILSQAKGARKSCYYSNYCGSYACSSGAKGSARAALLVPALSTGNLEIIPHAFVKELQSEKDKVTRAVYIDAKGNEQYIDANTFVVAAQAIETSRLLLNSKSAYFPHGLANNSGNVGKNLLFSGGGLGKGEFDTSSLTKEALFEEGTFVNRSAKQWYDLGEQKGGVIDFLWEHANPIAKANKLRWKEGKLLWGKALEERLEEAFLEKRVLSFEVFNDWLPNDDCYVYIDANHTDKYGVPVATFRIGAHERDVEVGAILAEKGEKILQQMGAKNIRSSVSPYPPQNLQAGGCRFGDDPKTSVLDKNCQAHEVKNLFVTDGSFMPTGGSVPYTWTIYANAFRVAEYMRRLA